MKKTALKPFEGKSYKSSFLTGFYTFFLPVTYICLLLGWYCIHFFGAYDYGTFVFTFHDLQFVLFTLGIFVGLAVWCTICICLCYPGSYVEVDKNGIRGKVKIGWVNEASTFVYKWTEIKDMEFSFNSVLIHTQQGIQSVTLPFLVSRNTKFLAAVHTFGGDVLGEQSLGERSLGKIRHRRKLFVPALCMIGAVLTIGAWWNNYSQPLYYSVHDVVFVGNDTYAVGYMCKRTSSTDRPVLWKNNVIQKLGPIGDFNEAYLVEEMGGDIYIYCRVDGKNLLLRNSKEFCNLDLPEDDFDGFTHVDAMVSYEDTLYVRGCSLHRTYSYDYDTIPFMWKYIKGEPEPSFVPLQTQSYDSIGEISQLFARNAVMSKEEFYQVVRSENCVGREMDFRYVKVCPDGSIYLLGKGKTDVRCKNGEKMTPPIWRYVDKGDTCYFEQI